VVGYDLTHRFLFGDPGGPRVPDHDNKEISWNYDPSRLRDKEPRLSIQFTDEDKRFGISLVEPGKKVAATRKRLTFNARGNTNNTCVKINESEYLFGSAIPNFHWIQKERRAPEPRQGWISRGKYLDEQVEVTQHVEIVPSETRLLDTCLVYYRLKNVGQGSPDVGLRVMLDTFIGSNDGVPFLVPGREGFVTKQASYTGSEVPDYVEAIEQPNDAKDPGTTVRMALKGIRLPGIELTPPDRFVICRHPENINIKWDWPFQDIGPDSAVAVYWNPQRLKAGETRHLAFTYGLGTLDVGDLLAVSAPSNVIPDREFVVTAYVYNATKGQKVSLELPEGLYLAGQEKSEKTVEETAPRVQVFWKVKASGTGRYEISATSGRSRSKPRVVEVRATSIFG
jgi:hypothetical protein